MPSFEPPASSGTSASALLKLPPSAFHEPYRPRLRARPQSQPTLPHINLSLANTSSTSIDRHLQQLESDPFISQGPSSGQPAETLAEEDGEYAEPASSFSSRPNRKRWSMAALAVHIEPVTARPTTSGEGRSKRFSLLLSGRTGASKKSPQLDGERKDNGLSYGAAVGQLNEILRNGKERI
jgi:hypothetical protein